MNNDYESQSITECHCMLYWPKWEEAIQAELTSLTKHDVFGPVA